MNNRLSTQQFIENARRVHGERYDYSQSVYTVCKESVVIICKEHGPFNQAPHKHVSGGAGCPQCGAINRVLNKPKNTKSKKTSRYSNKEVFIAELRRVYGDAYAFDVDRLNGYTSIIGVHCRLHGLTEVKAKDLHRGIKHCSGCSKVNKGGDSPKVFNRDKARAEMPCVLYIVSTSFGYYKIGISKNLSVRSKGRYTAVHYLCELPRASAWTVEQLLLIQTKDWAVDDQSEWCGHTELRCKAMPLKEIVKQADDLCQKIRGCGWEVLASELTCI